MAAPPAAMGGELRVACFGVWGCVGFRTDRIGSASVLGRETAGLDACGKSRTAIGTLLYR